MPGSFATYRVAKMRPPLAGPQGETWETTLGAMQDGELALLRVAALSRFPAYCPDDGLDLLGQTFALPRMSGQSNDSYRATLVNAWPTYEEGGSPQAIEDALRAYGIADVRVVLEEQNHGATTAYNGAGSYNTGQLVATGGNVYEQVGPNGAGAASAPPSGMGQTQADGQCVWAWRCAVSQDANDSGYVEWWYSRFDVVLGGQTAAGFGTLSVNKFIIGAALGVTAGSFTAPAVGSSVSVALASGSLTVGAVVYVAQAGYYQVASGSGPYMLTNLGDAAAAYAVWWNANHADGQAFAPDVWGAPGQFPNATGTIASGQTIVAGGTGIIGQTRIGIAIVDDDARVAVKSLILRWKATHGYAGRIVLAYDGAILDPAGQSGVHNGLSYIGKMIGLDFVLGSSTIGGYDRS